MIDCCPQVFELTPGRSIGRALLGITPAAIAVHLCKGFVTEIAEQGPCTLRRLFWPRTLGCHIPHIAGDYVGDRDGSWITGAARTVEPFLRNVFGEKLDSPFTIVNAASSALLVSTIVADEPHGLVGDRPGFVSPLAAEPESRSFGCFRHSSLIRSIAASVV